MPISRDVQKPNVGVFWEGFDIDLSKINQNQTLVYRFTQSTYESSAVVWQGNTYTPIDIVAEGFEATTEGSLPRPTLMISNVARTLLSTIIQLKDCVGAKVTRWRTLRAYLDGQLQASENTPNLQIMPKDIYVIDRKVEQNPLYVKWELASLLDFEGRKFPWTQFLKDFCQHTYRRGWNGSSFAYNHTNHPELITCPYGSASMPDVGFWTSSDVTTANGANDMCSKKITGCRLRANGLPLPTTAVPGLGRVRDM